MDEGKQSFSQEFFDDAEPVYRSLPTATVETAAHPSAHSSVLAEDDIYRDLPGSDMAGGIAAPPGFLQAHFDPAERTYRSLPCSTFGEGSVEADGAEYMGMGMEFGFGGAADMRPGADFGASEAMFSKAASAPQEFAFAAAANAPVVPPAVPRPPFRLEATHYASLGDASTTVQTLSMLFAAFNIDVTYKPEKCKFKCLSHVEHEKVAFNVKLFTRNMNQVVVEFQRRMGGALQFKSLYAALRDGMVKHKLCVAPLAPAPGTLSATVSGQFANANNQVLAPPSLKGSSSSAFSSSSSSSSTGVGAPPTLRRCFAPPPLPVQADEDLTPQQRKADADAKCEAIDNLLAMANEPQGAEVAREAAKTLAVLSESTDGIANFDARPEDVIPRIVALLTVEDDDIQRCAAAALANVCERLPHLQQQVVDCRALRALVGLVSQLSPQEGVMFNDGSVKTTAPDGRLECVRHCTRALANLCVSHADAIDKVGGVELMTDLHQNPSADKACCDHANQFMASLSSRKAGMSN